MGALLRVENLSKSFGSQRVLHCVSFTLEQGNILCILGPSGSGKTGRYRHRSASHDF